MAKTRSKIPNKTVEKLMFDNDHTCCMCQQRNKHVQIHHADGDPRNNNPNNLFVCCNDCHSKVESDQGLGRKYTEGEIRMYKRSWELKVRKIREGPRTKILYVKELISQIDLIACEIASYEDTDKRIPEKLDLLFELHIYGGFSFEIDKKILEVYRYLALQAISAYNITVLLCEKLYELCLHFVGPDDVKMNKNDKEFVLECLDVLETIGQYSGEYLRRLNATKSVCRSVYNFFEIATWYNFEKLAIETLEVLNSTKKACSRTYEGSIRKFSGGIKLIDFTLRKIKKTHDKEKLHWPRFSSRLNRLMK